MDKLVAVALQEISAEGTQGCSLPKLWSELQSTAAGIDLPLCRRVKQILWKRLIDLPGMQYKTLNLGPSAFSDLSIQDVERAEDAGVILLAPETLRDSCLGIYDLKYADSRLSDLQRAILERVARARSKGVPQNQLGKEFGVEGNKLFYVLRGLEIRGLVVRQSIILRNDDTVNNENRGIISTNLVHLSRYAKQVTLGAHQRFEARNATDSFSFETNLSAAREPEEDDAASSQANKILINDDLPAMKAICDKLEEAEGKVLVVSDIKMDLRYRMAAGHRAWRRLIKRMQTAGLVKIFDAEIDQKVVSCIRLCKSFDVHAFDQMDTENDQTLKAGKRGQPSELVVELPIDQQIFDMIRKEQAEGLPMVDIWKRLGLNNKRNYYRVHNMITKHGIVFEAENHKRCMMYRLRATSHVPGTRDDHAAAASLLQQPIKTPADAYSFDRNNLQRTEEEPRRRSLPSDRERVPDMRPLKRFRTSHLGSSSSLGCATLAVVKQDCEATGMEPLVSFLEEEVNANIEDVQSPQDLHKGPESHELTNISSASDLVAAPANICLAGQYPALFRAGQPYPCVNVTTTSVLREKRILERLERENFIIRSELHRWLEEQENRTAMMDRKTLTRILQKLQRENRCKCVLLNMPGSTNCGRNRTTEVILLPSIVVEPDLLCRIHDSVRKFEIQSHTTCVSRAKKSTGVLPVLTGVKRMSPLKPGKKVQTPLGSTLEKSGSMMANGFVHAKMVRVRMLHLFLWEYVSGLQGSNAMSTFSRHNTSSGITLNTIDSYKIFALGDVIQTLPLEMFLQIVGSTKKFDNLLDRVKGGLRVRDLSAAEHAELVDINARGRLSWLVDILRRLKLVRLVVGSGPIIQPRKQVTKTFLSTLEAALTYAMETNAYIEEPASSILPALSPDDLDVTPRTRHEFSFCNKDDINTYWETLEYCFSGAERTIARRAFPGSNVPELFGLRSWTALRVMSVDQRNELLKRISAGGAETRISAQECAKIAKDLNLTLEQVLKVSYEKNQSFRLQSLQKPSLTVSDLLFKRTSKVGSSIVVDHCDALSKTFPSRKEDKVEADFEEEIQEENPTNHASFVSGLKPSRKNRFSWSDKLDRNLVLCYARQRALLGSGYSCVDWASIQNLPAPPRVCRRRMAQLKSDSNVRFAIMNLCQIFADRYEKYQQLFESLGNPSALSTDAARSEMTKFSKEGQIGNQVCGFVWDDAEDHSIVLAIEEIIKCKELTRRRTFGQTSDRFDNSRSLKEAEHAKEQSDHQEFSSTVATPVIASVGESPALKDEAHLQKSSGSNKKTMACYSSLKKIKWKPSFKESVILEKLVRNSISVANAVEFIKLIYLNMPASEENVRLPKHFAEGLRLFKEQDIFAAFNFLRQKDLVAFQQSTRAFSLSQKFYFKASKSRFPEGTSQGCTNARSWLDQRKAELQQDWIPFSLEIGYGHLLHLFRLATAGELSLSPLMPCDGIGESNEPTNLSFNKKNLNIETFAALVTESASGDAEDSCEISRRERGFPGLKVSLHLASIPVSQLSCADLSVSMDLATSRKCGNSDLNMSEVFPSCDPSLGYSTRSLEEGRQISNGADEFNLATCISHWSEVPKQGESVCVNCNLLRTACQIVDRAGEDGLRIEQLAESLHNDGSFQSVDCAKLVAYVEALQSLNLVEQVNAYDHVRIVGTSHSSRYFFYTINFVENGISDSHMHQASVYAGARVNGLALPSLEISRHLSENSQHECITSSDSIPPHIEAASHAKDHTIISSKGAWGNQCNSMPILPWLTVDGSMNSPIFNALLHRVIGIVVLNPGIMEDDLVKQLDVLNPESSRRLLQVLELEGYILVRIVQISKAEPPFLLRHLINQETGKTRITTVRSFYPCPSFTSILQQDHST